MWLSGDAKQLGRVFFFFFCSAPYKKICCIRRLRGEFSFDGRYFRTRSLNAAEMTLHVRIQPSSRSAVMSTDCLTFFFFFLLPRRRDESASATYYFRHGDSERASGGDPLVKEWMYYRPLQRGESEFPLRNKQVLYSFLPSRCCDFVHFPKVRLMKTSSSRINLFSIIAIPPQTNLWSVLRVSSFKPVSTVHLQVKQRASECILALDRLTQINSGVPVRNVLQTQFDWTTLQVDAGWSSEPFR